MSSDKVLSVLMDASAAVADALSKVPRELVGARAFGHADQYQVDLAADAAAMKVLLGRGLGAFSEESGAHEPHREIQVVVDPVDGSTNCGRQLDPYGPSMCAYDAGGPLAAVVTNLASGTQYCAIRGGGATRNGVAIRRLDRDAVTFLVTGDPCPELEHPAWTRVSGASAHDLCRVADGTFDGYVDKLNTQSVWDYLGASLVITETGGVVAEVNGLALLDLKAHANRKLVAAGSPQLFAQLRDLLLARGVPTPAR